MDGGHAGQRGGQLARHREGVVGARVVDDRDERPEGERLVEEGAQRSDPLGQLGRLVVDRHDDLDVHRDPTGVGVGLHGSQGCHGSHGAEPASGFGQGRLWARCESRPAPGGGGLRRRIRASRPPAALVVEPAQCAHRDPHGHRHALPRRGLGRDGAAVRGHDGRDDGEAQAAAPADAGAGRVGPVEALEDATGLLVGHAGARVAHLHLGLVADLVHPHGRRGPRRRVGAHVREQVVDHLAQAVLVADHLDRVRGPEAHRPLRPDGGGGAHRLRRQGRPAPRGPCSMGTPSSSRARVSRSLTRRSMRAVSVRMPDITLGRSSERSRRRARTARHRPTPRRWVCGARGRRRRRTGAGAARTP